MPKRGIPRVALPQQYCSTVYGRIQPTFFPFVRIHITTGLLLRSSRTKYKVLAPGQAAERGYIRGGTLRFVCTALLEVFLPDKEPRNDKPPAKTRFDGVFWHVQFPLHGRDRPFEPFFRWCVSPPWSPHIALTPASTISVYSAGNCRFWRVRGAPIVFFFFLACTVFFWHMLQVEIVFRQRSQLLLW